ncbi:UbiA family prenyltransferase [Paraglaciecola aquimarina]|uniref:UbiA family prenyltransferase n=1 Tax=Paraglaciecola algarum TaxID=3050085 RepID=A0ABS9D3A0_9ALTE|nr:UbiA family prenyltransferase [Paraglaciecola sp. G1-23]MCF2946922.1 UbiA family prenyltransferase [Paraglaciecola sp. G1-23]
MTQNIIHYLKLVRAPAGFTALSNILAASVLMTNGQLNLSIIYLLFASVCFYFAGMTLNDCFDFKEDLAQRPSRPIPSGNVSLNKAWMIGAGLMVVGLILSFSFSTLSGYVGLALCVAIIGYNGLIKEGLFGSFCMAACRYLNWLLGASFVALSTQSFLIAVPIFAYITGLTYLSKQETTAQNKHVIWFTAFTLLITMFSSGYLLENSFAVTGIQRWLAWGLLLVWSCLVLNKLRLVFQTFSPASIQQMIIFMVIGVIPLDALLVAMAGHYWFAFIIIALLPPTRMLNKRLNAIT